MQKIMDELNDNINFDENYLLEIIDKFVGDYLQNFHHYSSIQVKNNLKNPLEMV